MKSWAIALGVMAWLAPLAWGWQVDSLPAQFTYRNEGAKQVGWQLVVPETAKATLRDLVIRIGDKELRLPGALKPGQVVTVLADGKVVDAPESLIANKALVAVDLPQTDRTAVSLSAQPGAPAFDFRFLLPDHTGWRWPNASFEEAGGWRLSVLEGKAQGGATNRVAHSGSKSLYITSEDPNSAAILKSPMIPATPADLAVAKGNNSGAVMITVRIKAVGVKWPHDMPHGGGPRLTLRYYDGNKKYLYQDVITNLNGANQVIEGTTDGWVTMRGYFKRVQGTSPLRYVQLYLAHYGQGTVYFDDIQMQARQTLFAEQIQTYVEPLPKPQNPLPQLDPTSLNRGFVAFRCDPTVTMLPNYLPRQDEIGQDNLEVKYAAARGEVTGTSLGVFSAAKDVQIASEYVPQTLPASWLSFYSVRCWPQSNNLGTRAKVVPEVLDPLDVLTLSEHQSKQLWITTRVPEDAKPGQYTGTLKLSGGDRNYEVRLMLTVRPFVLASNTRIAQELFYAVAAPHPISKEPLPPWLMKMELADMVDHGVNMVHLQTCMPSIGRGADGKVSFSYKPFDAIIQAYREVGLDRMPMSLYFAHFDQKLAGVTGLTWDSPEFAELYVQAVSGLHAYLKERGVSGLVLRLEDEAGNFPHVQKEVEHELKAIARTPAISEVNTGNVTEWVKSIMPLVRVARIYNFTDELAEEIRRHKTTFLFSAVSCSEGEFGYQRYIGGQVAYKAGEVGAMGVSWYTYRTAYFSVDVWNELETGGHGEMTIYPHPKTMHPIPTLQWEAVRQGINDLRYLLTLDEAIERAQANPSFDATTLSQMRQYRQNLLANTPVSSKEVREQARRLTWSDYEAMRETISQWIGQTLPQN